MKLHHLAIAVAGVCLLAAGLFLLQERAERARGAARTETSLVPRDVLAAANRFEITSSGSTANLGRGPDGVWIVENYHGLPVDFDRLARLIRDLAAAKLDDIASTSAETIARLEFGSQRIVVHSVNGTNVDVEIGKTAAGGGRFVRRSGDATAYISSFNAFLDGSPRGWADTRLASFEPSAVRTVRARFSDGSVFEAKRADALASYSATGLPDGRQLDLTALDRLVTTLANLRFTDTAEPEAEEAIAARQNERTYEIVLDSGATLSFAIGRRPASPAPTVPSAGSEETSEATPPATPPPQAAGPVFVRMTHSDPNARINDLMRKRAFQIGEWLWSQFPENPAGFAVAPPPATEPAAPTPSQPSEDAHTDPEPPGD